MPRGLFITFEGLDGSGKTTQINRLAAWLKKRGRSALITRQPGGTKTGDRIRALVLDSRSKGLAPMTEMALMFADRAQVIAEVVKPALAAGEIILCDRYTDSTEAWLSPLGSSLIRSELTHTTSSPTSTSLTSLHLTTSSLGDPGST